MNKKTKFLVVGVFLCTLTNPSPAQQDLIARYPLNSTANDTTGHYGPMTLMNTPFQEGGIYCNGIYQYSGDPNWCEAVTPRIDGFNFKTFSIQARFKVRGYYTGSRPVFVCGRNSRWLSFWLWRDSTVAMMYPPYLTSHSTIRYSVNSWHEASITYDSASGIGKFYLDTSLAGSIQFHLAQGDIGDTNVTITFNGYSNTVFTGIMNDLKIYSAVVDPTKSNPSTGLKNTSPESPAGFSLAQNYPNPFNPSTIIRYHLRYNQPVILRLYDLLGREVRVLVDQFQTAGDHSVQFDADCLPGGVYFYQLHAGRSVETKRLVVLR